MNSNSQSIVKTKAQRQSFMPKGNFTTSSKLYVLCCNVWMQGIFYANTNENVLCCVFVYVQTDIFIHPHEFIMRFSVSKFIMFGFLRTCLFSIWFRLITLFIMIYVDLCFLTSLNLTHSIIVHITIMVLKEIF